MKKFMLGITLGSIGGLLFGIGLDMAKRGLCDL